MTNEEFADALITETKKATPADDGGFQGQGIGDLFSSLQNGITWLKAGAANWASRQTLDAVEASVAALALSLATVDIVGRSRQ